MKKRIFAGLALALAGCGPQHEETIAAETVAPPPAAAEAAPAATAGPIAVFSPWMRPPAPGQTIGAAFMTIRNLGDAADRLVKASSPAAGSVELHTHTHHDGMMKMEMIPAIEAPAHGEAALAPGGLHLMLFDLKQPLGESIDITLTFEKAGEVTVATPVQTP